MEEETTWDIHMETHNILEERIENLEKMVLFLFIMNIIIISALAILFIMIFLR